MIVMVEKWKQEIEKELDKLKSLSKYDLGWTHRVPLKIEFLEGKLIGWNLAEEHFKHEIKGLWDNLQELHDDIDEKLEEITRLKRVINIMDHEYEVIKAEKKAMLARIEKFDKIPMICSYCQGHFRKIFNEELTGKAGKGKEAKK